MLILISKWESRISNGRSYYPSQELIAVKN
jgi:hypothetical protein